MSAGQWNEARMDGTRYWQLLVRCLETRVWTLGEAVYARYCVELRCGVDESGLWGGEAASDWNL